MAKNGGNTGLLLVLGGLAVWLLGSHQAAPASGTAQAPIWYWLRKDGTNLVFAPGLLPPDGLGPVETAWRPASSTEIEAWFGGVM